jgi:surfactin synthase thioesterase subunit
MLFGFPHCGGQDEAMLAWSRGLPSRFRFIGIKLSKSLSFPDTLTIKWERVVNEAAACVKAAAEDGEDFAFIGHCWGSLLAFEVSHRLKAEGAREPVHLFLSGCRAPHLLQARSESLKGPWSLYSLASGCQAPPDYRVPPWRDPLQSRFSVFAEKRDAGVFDDQLAEWSRYTSRICDVHIGDGEHEFWQQDSIKWLQLVQTIMEREYAG